MDKAFSYVKDNKGIDTEDSYQYKAEDGKWHFKQENIGVDIVVYVDIEIFPGSELKHAVADQELYKEYWIVKAEASMDTYGICARRSAG